MNGVEFWRDHVTAIDREGWVASEYARLHGLSVASLYYWRSKLRAMRAESGSGKFLTIDMPAMAPGGGGCTLMLAGVRLDMPTLPTPEWLAALARASQGGR